MTTTTIKATGNLTEAPEIRYGDDGKPFTYLKVAVNNVARTADGEYIDLDPIFYTVPVRGRLAENLAQSVTKGTAITFDGKYRPRARITDDGQVFIDHLIQDADVHPDLTYATATITRNPKKNAE